MGNLKSPINNLFPVIRQAARIIKGGGLVAYPTETFYGLGVDATNRDAIARLFFVKGRQENKPILILICSEDMLKDYVAEIPTVASSLIKHFWPGPLTLIMKARNCIPDILTGGTGNVGVRLSSNPIATTLVREVGVPITSTSANRANEPPCNSTDDVRRALGDDIDFIIDAGETPGGEGSTILDITTTPPRVVRMGKITVANLKDVLGDNILL